MYLGVAIVVALSPNKVHGLNNRMKLSWLRNSLNKQGAIRLLFS